MLPSLLLLLFLCSFSAIPQPNSAAHIQSFGGVDMAAEQSEAPLTFEQYWVILQEACDRITNRLEGISDQDISGEDYMLYYKYPNALTWAKLFTKLALENHLIILSKCMTNSRRHSKNISIPRSYHVQVKRGMKL
uniref:Uncharacterized protein n=1 Tax=Nelumbo nucifera TaxID=4432 RepID=A0A822YLH2_NELNU|nr:TPA_asm: hypothetical protein HUJ06_012233 [Nelumbo nucifera]